MQPCKPMHTNPRSDKCESFALQDVASSSCAVCFVMVGLHVHGGVSKQGLGFGPSVAVHLWCHTCVFLETLQIASDAA